MEEYNDRSWICYGCQGGCKCADCTEIRQLGRNEKFKTMTRSKESKKSGGKASLSRQYKLQDSSYSPPPTKVMVLDGQQVKKEDLPMPEPEDDGKDFGYEKSY